MLFNSYIFILAFLPVTFLGYYFLRQKFPASDACIQFLVLASFFFYGWWNYIYVLLIIVSIIFNFSASYGLTRVEGPIKKSLFIVGVAFNLGLLGYFKYADFFITNINALTSAELSLLHLALPLAISFFTFQQIAYLCDVYSGEVKEYRFIHYCLFVTFFPQLIAGPIVHHKEMLPQFARARGLLETFPEVAMGLTIFAMGLFKKTVLADSIAAYATPLFDAALGGATLTFFEGWFAALSYTLQLYFDFSGYSDMAIGAALLFGIHLPINFNSPYKSFNIIDFWRRWHITLSRFLRDYLYIPLGGNRGGNVRRYANLLVTMLLGGLWHGAGWTFVVWGLLHGCYLMINHGWHYIMRQLNLDLSGSRLYRSFCWLLTFLAVVVGWVFFRAESFDAAAEILSAMFGFNGIVMPEALRFSAFGLIYDLLGVRFTFGGGENFALNSLWIMGLMIVAICFPNTQEIMNYRTPNADGGLNEGFTVQTSVLTDFWRRQVYQYSRRWAVISGVFFAVGILALTSISEFLYFQF